MGLHYNAILSLRTVVFKGALQDIEVCHALDTYIGNDAVIYMVEEAAGGKLTLTYYPRNGDFIVENMKNERENCRVYNKIRRKLRKNYDLS